MKSSSYQIKPTLKPRPTFFSSYDRTLDVLQMSLKDVRQELMQLLKPNRWIHFSDEALLTVLHDQAEAGVRTDLYYQLHTCRVPYQPEVCNYIIETLDPHGFFPYHKEQPFPFPTSQVDQALALIQSFEPIGIAVENSTEYLILQLRRRKEEKAVRLMTDLSELVVQGELAEVRKQLALSEAELNRLMKVIRSCPLYPCELEAPAAEWIRPDVRLEAENGKLNIIPALSELPPLSCPQKDLSEQAKAYLKQNNLLIDMINQRNLTLLQIFHALTEIQKDHFLKGSAMKPCRLADVSALCGVHPSTISRCCRTKYYEFDGQLHSFRTLLASGNLQGKSHDEVHEKLVELLQTEDPSSPYSDDQLIHLFEEQGIQFSRRTIAKLRLKWKIPNSYQRKQKVVR